jgi:hypothetical protein
MGYITYSGTVFNNRGSGFPQAVDNSVDNFAGAVDKFAENCREGSLSGTPSSL